MGTVLSSGVGRSHLKTGENGLHRVDYQYLEMERAETFARIRELIEAIFRFEEYKKALIEWHKEHQYEDLVWLVERINERIAGMRKELSILREISKDMDMVIDCEKFAYSDWIQALLLGNSLTGEDIIRGWAEEAETIYNEPKDKKYHSRKKISEATIRQILKLYDEGLKRKYIAERMKVSMFTVNKHIRERYD